MSKIGNYRVEFQESEDYRFGWESAERGEPAPKWEIPMPGGQKFEAQTLGWNDFHTDTPDAAADNRNDEATHERPNR